MKFNFINKFVHLQMMRKLFIILLCLPLFIQGQSWKDLKKAAKKVNKELINKNPFSEEEAANALKETLNKGTEKGVSVLSVKDGYFANPKVKIPFPKNATKVADKLKQLGMQKKVDEVILSINRAAEDAAVLAKPIFVGAIKKMSIKDAIGIVKGAKTSGTDYLNKNTNTALGPSNQFGVLCAFKDQCWMTYFINQTSDLSGFGSRRHILFIEESPWRRWFGVFSQ